MASSDSVRMSCRLYARDGYEVMVLVDVRYSLCDHGLAVEPMT
jgi:hypothetical protein